MLHAAQWASGGTDVLHMAMAQPMGQTSVRLQCDDDNARQNAVENGIKAFVTLPLLDQRIAPLQRHSKLGTRWYSRKGTRTRTGAV